MQTFQYNPDEDSEAIKCTGCHEEFQKYDSVFTDGFDFWHADCKSVIDEAEQTRSVLEKNQENHRLDHG